MAAERRDAVSQVPRVKRPCAECPWKVDTEPGQFPACNYERLRNTSDVDEQPGINDPFFACHKTPEGEERACAGWLAVEGHAHVGVRLAVAMGRLPAEALEPGPDWPQLFGSFREMAERQAAE